MVEMVIKSFEYMRLCLNDPLLAPLVPVVARPAVMVLWQLDERMGELARTGREPALRQIRLRWWHDQLAALTPGAHHADPLLHQVAQHLLPGVPSSALTALVDAWEDVACAEQGGQGNQEGAHHSPSLNTAHANAQTNGATHRGALLFAATAHLLGHADGDVIQSAGLGWAAVGNAQYAAVEQGGGQGTDAAAWQLATAILSNISYHKLPRALAALTALARSIAAQNGQRRPRAEQLLVLRVGLIGR